ncbi:MAG: Uma2 family endonuclease [Roseiflexaceae bacterium]|nr:Uma2 family endonuclease [Roseiflexaceae bacterium]
MAIDTQLFDLKLVRIIDGQEIDLHALQGMWTVEQYLKLTDQTNQLIEYTDGVIEVLPMPTDKHQAISQMLFLALLAFVQHLGGKVFYAPLRVQVRPGRFREPDLLLLLDANDPRRQNAFWFGADLVVEIVSPDRPERDTEEKPVDYSQAHIPEYWIVNPIEETISVLVLDGEIYRVAGVFKRDQIAASVLLDGFSIAVADVFDAH